MDGCIFHRKAVDALAHEPIDLLADRRPFEQFLLRPNYIFVEPYGRSCLRFERSHIVHFSGRLINERQ